MEIALRLNFPFSMQTKLDEPKLVPLSNILKSLKHAFAVAPELEPTREELEAVDQLCAAVVRRGMTTPCLLFLETSRPLNFIGAAAMHFFEPILSFGFPSETRQQLVKFLERRDSIDHLCHRLQEQQSALEKKPLRPFPDGVEEI